MTSKLKKLKSPAVISSFLALITGVLAWNMFSFISRYSANILYWDLWDFYYPLFYYKNLWQIFSWQHGPHREGIGLIFTYVLANLTHWNTKADSFAIGTLLYLASLTGFTLKRRLFGSLGFLDATIPLIFLTMYQYEALVVVPNLSYGAFPILLIMIYCLVFTLERVEIRYILVLILNFLLIYTGFGMFMGIITVLLLLTDIHQNRFNKNRLWFLFAVLALALLSNASFFISYRFNPAISNFSITPAYFLKYPVFVGLMFACFWGIQRFLGHLLAMYLGFGLLLIFKTVFITHCQKVIRDGIYESRISLMISILIGYSLLFSFDAAIGRMPLGVLEAEAPRYLTLLIPAYLGLYFHLQTLRVEKLRYIFLTACLVMSVLFLMQNRTINLLGQNDYNQKTAWEKCYLQYEDVEFCNKETQFKIYPRNTKLLNNKLSFLKENQLNLFMTAEK